MDTMAKRAPVKTALTEVMLKFNSEHSIIIVIICFTEEHYF